MTANPPVSPQSEPPRPMVEYRELVAARVARRRRMRHRVAAIAAAVCVVAAGGAWAAASGRFLPARPDASGPGAVSAPASAPSTAPAVRNGPEFGADQWANQRCPAGWVCVGDASVADGSVDRVTVRPGGTVRITLTPAGGRAWGVPNLLTAVPPVVTVAGGTGRGTITVRAGRDGQATVQVACTGVACPEPVVTIEVTVAS